MRYAGETGAHYDPDIGNFFHDWGGSVVHFEQQDTDVPPHFRCQADDLME